MRGPMPFTKFCPGESSALSFPPFPQTLFSPGESLEKSPATEVEQLAPRTRKDEEGRLEGSAKKAGLPGPHTVSRSRLRPRLDADAGEDAGQRRREKRGEVPSEGAERES